MTHDVDIATGLLEAVAPLRMLVDEVAAGRRELAAHHALALEQKLSAVPQQEKREADARETSATVARLRKLAGS